MLDISNFPWAECSITENRVIYQSDSLALKRAKRTTGVMRYEFELVTIDMDMKQGRGLKAKLSAATDDTLYFVHPRLGYSQGTEPANALRAVGPHAAGLKYIDLNSVNTWQLMAGDYISLSNDTKVYEVAEDTALQSGTQRVNLTAELRMLTPDATIIKMNDVGWYLTSNGAIEVSMEASSNQDMELTLVAVEKL